MLRMPLFFDVRPVLWSVAVLAITVTVFSNELLAGEVNFGSQAGSIVIEWNQALLQGVRDSRIGPPMVARALAVVHTCMYDAWSAYDSDALSTQLGGQLRQPVQRRVQSNVE